MIWLGLVLTVTVMVFVTMSIICLLLDWLTEAIVHALKS